MAAFSVATGVSLLYAEGVLPPNPERQAIAFASPAQQTKLESDGFALKDTATALAMEDESPNGTVELSSTAMQSLVQDLSTPDITVATKAHSSQSTTQSSGYPYSGWSSVSDDNSLSAGSSASETASAASPTTTGTAINLLA